MDSAFDYIYQFTDSCLQHKVVISSQYYSTVTLFARLRGLSTSCSSANEA